MQKNARADGFTLIELLVVIGILSLLVVAFAPDIFGALGQGQKAADKANLSWHYTQLTNYRQKYKKLPPKTGHKFVLASWIDGVCQKTEQNFKRYWTPGLEENDQTYLDLAEQVKLEPKAVWKTFDDVTSLDTHYAGVGSELRKSRKRLYGNGEVPLMSNDNEGLPSFEDHGIHVLMGDSVVREFNFKDLSALGFSGDADSDEVFLEIGPESEVELFQKLDR